jgi:hypothetical protein
MVNAVVEVRSIKEYLSNLGLPCYSICIRVDRVRKDIYNGRIQIQNKRTRNAYSNHRTLWRKFRSSSKEH